MAEKSLIEYLLANSIITEDQRAHAQRLAASSNCSLFDALVKTGAVREETIAAALSKWLGHPYASLENKLLIVERGQELEQLVPEKFARENTVLPLFLEGKTLAVALADPEDLMVIENLKVLTKCDVQPFVATKSQLLKVIDGFYAKAGSDLISRTIAAAGPAAEKEMSRREGHLDLDKAATGEAGAEAVGVVNAILKQAVTERCSDIHLETFDNDVMLRFRIDGVLHERTAPPSDLFTPIISRIKILSRLDIAERRLPQDGMFSVGIHNRQVDVRVSVCPADYGEKIVMRVLDKDAVELDMDKIGFDPKQKEDFLSAAREPHGLIFLTGPTGSGKTTTLYTLLNTIRTTDLNFMTIEDPIEIKLKGITQVQVKSSIGLTFASALRSFLRQDPDVILVGEVRDAETAQTCLRAALTGHLVLSTLHTNDALSSVVRLIDLAVEPYLLASSLSLVAAQRLVRVLCPQCKKPVKPTAEQLRQCQAEAQLPGPLDPAKVVFFEPKGCDACARTGYRGRAGIYEIYRINSVLRQIIYRDRGDIAKLKTAAAESGMWNLRASAWRKALLGITSVDEALSMTTAD